jgi:undecaprenyl-diphosphatase
MTIFEATVLAVIQGLTEFLPISSSAHLALTPWLFGWKDQGLTFDIALHFGTLCAVLLYFMKDWLQLASQGLRIGNFAPDPLMAKQPNLLWWLAAASVPVGVAGLLLKDYTETTLRSPWVMGTTLILFGILMGLADSQKARRKFFDGITFPDAMVVGCAQALALIPGVSRSGVTLTAGLFRNIDRASAARFSFLLSTPATAVPRFPQSRRHCSRHGGALRRRDCRQRAHRIGRHCLLPQLPASPKFAGVRHLPHCFWHNSDRSSDPSRPSLGLRTDALFRTDPPQQA